MRRTKWVSFRRVTSRLGGHFMNKKIVVCTYEKSNDEILFIKPTYIINPFICGGSYLD